MSYSQQLKIKEDKIKNSFASFLNTDAVFFPIIPCLPEWQYRNKMEFSFAGEKSKNEYLGLIMDSSKGKIFNLTECHLVNSWFAEALKAARDWWKESGLHAYYPPKDFGSLRNLTVREGKSSGDRMVMLTVSGNPDFAVHRHQLDSFVAFLRAAIEPVDPQSNLSIVLRIHQILKGKPTQFYEMVLYGPDHIRETIHITDKIGGESFPLLFHISPSAFFQPNPRQAEKIYSLAMQMAGIPENGVVYDLYCGGGALGMCAARKAKLVLGIELSPESSLDARENAKRNQLENVTILTGSVGEVLDKIRNEKSYPLLDVVMVDPPRAGLDPAAIANLKALAAPKIVYISCNPDSQVKNVEMLIDAGYRLKGIQPVDQFPHTIHIENIVMLEKL